MDGLKKNLILLFCAGVMAVSGCASSPELSRLEAEALRRREVLPEGVSAYRLFAGTSFNGEGDSHLFPLFWEQGVSEKFTLLWLPLPIGFRYSIEDQPRRWTWIEFDALGFLYSQQSSFLWRPNFALTCKWLLDDSWGASVGAIAQAEIVRDPFAFGPTIGARAGVERQLSRKVLIAAAVMPLYEKGETKARYLGGAPSDALERESGGRMRLPAELKASYMPSVQWRGDLQLFWYEVGYPSGYRRIPVFLTFSHYW